MTRKRIVAFCMAFAVILSGITLKTFAEEEKNVDQLSFFEIQGAEAKLKEDAIDFTLKNDTATIRFKNPLAASGFSVRWNGVNDKAKKLEALVFGLQDYQNEEIGVNLAFGKMNDQNISVKYNTDKRTYLTAGSMNAKNDTDVYVQFNEVTKSFVDGAGNYTIKVENSINGMKFQGFDSLGVNMTITMKGKKGASFSLRELNGQPLGKKYENDTVEPVLCVPGDQTNVVHNSITELPKAAAFDVFTDTTTLKLTVQDPEGNSMKDVDGKVLEDVDGNKQYRIKFSQYGQYRVMYVASDGVNKTRKIGYQIDIQYKGVPTIALEEAIPETVPLHEEVIFPTTKVDDQLKGEIVQWVNVTHPEGYITCEEASFVPKTEGIYKITFSALDENGNIGRLEVNVYAEGSTK